MKTIRASIIGFGAVGQGVAEVLLQKKEYLNEIGLDIKVIAISDSKGSCIDEKGVDLTDALKRKGEDGTVAIENKPGIEVINDIDHELVIETTPTSIIDGGVGLPNMVAAFEHGRDVVTSNKGPLVLKYRELNEIAEKNNAKFRFEATVGGAMPTINLSKDTLAGNDIISIEGILNGTCNYILSRMLEEKASYEQMLAESQELGIAETDPTYDVEGIDTACKLVILANTIFKKDTTFANQRSHR